MNKELQEMMEGGVGGLKVFSLIPGMIAVEAGKVLVHVWFLLCREGRGVR